MVSFPAQEVAGKGDAPPAEVELIRSQDDTALHAPLEEVIRVPEGVADAVVVSSMHLSFLGTSVMVSSKRFVKASCEAQWPMGVRQYR